VGGGGGEGRSSALQVFTSTRAGHGMSGGGGALTSLGLRVQMGLFSFSTLQSHMSSYVVFITGSTSPASRPSSSAFLASASFFLAVASSSTTWGRGRCTFRHQRWALWWAVWVWHSVALRAGYGMQANLGRDHCSVKLVDRVTTYVHLFVRPAAAAPACAVAPARQAPPRSPAWPPS
jgi:hypothetical protein